MEVILLWNKTKTFFGLSIILNIREMGLMSDFLLNFSFDSILIAENHSKLA